MTATDPSSHVWRESFSIVPSQPSPGFSNFTNWLPTAAFTTASSSQIDDVAGATGAAFILVAREEEESLARIERQVGHRLPRVTLPEFDYKAPAPPKSAGEAPPGFSVKKPVKV